MKKLYLDEDLDLEGKLMISNMLQSLIKGEWDAIELYNSTLATLSSTQNFSNNLNADVADVKSVIEDIVKEEYIHIGQLEKILQAKDENSIHIEDGKVEAAIDTQQVTPIAQIQPQVTQSPLQDMIVVQPEVEVEESMSQDVAAEEARLIDRFGPEVMDYIDEYVDEKNRLSDDEKLNYVHLADRERYANPSSDWDKRLDDSKIWSYLWYSQDGWNKFADWARQKYNVSIK